MNEALVYFGAATIILSVLTVLFVFEDARGGKFLIPRVRNGLDSVLQVINKTAGFESSFFKRGFVRLVIHYVMHSVLGTVLHFLRGLEQRVERIAHRNKKAAKDIVSEKKTKNHLDEIADYKTEVALTDEEKEERRGR